MQAGAAEADTAEEDAVEADAVEADAAEEDAAKEDATEESAAEAGEGAAKERKDARRRGEPTGARRGRWGSLGKKPGQREQRNCSGEAAGKLSQLAPAS